MYVCGTVHVGNKLDFQEWKAFGTDWQDTTASYPVQGNENYANGSNK